MSSINREQIESLVVRLLYSLLFFLLLRLSWVLLVVLAVMQFLYRVLNANEPHPGLQGFGLQLAQWYQQATGYVLGASEAKAWPLADWPANPLADEQDSAKDSVQDS